MAISGRCVSCAGAGELPTDYGLVDCPDCGGSGTLPTRAVLTDWRARDLSRALAQEKTVATADVSWLLDELRATRTALMEVIALAHDIRDDEQIALRIRMVASQAVGLYQPAEPEQAHEPRAPRHGP